MQRRLLLGLVAALAIYLGLTTAFGLEQVGSSLRALPWIWWLVGPAICLSSHLLLLGRWQFYLHWLGYPLPLKAGARIYAAGLALIAAPGRSGEALRGLWLQRRHGFPLTVGVGITLALPCLIGVVALMRQPDLSRRSAVEKTGRQNDAPEGHS